MIIVKYTMSISRITVTTGNPIKVTGKYSKGPNIESKTGILNKDHSDLYFTTP